MTANTLMDSGTLVYQYQYWDDDCAEHKVSSFYATLETIKNGLGTPVYSTAQVVPREHVTAGGFYLPEEMTDQ